jgi:hypothetical protein
MNRPALFGISILLMLGCLNGCSTRTAPLVIGDWSRGLSIASRENPDMRTFLYFFEWHMFDAILPGMHTQAFYRPGEWPREGIWALFNRNINADSSYGVMSKADMKLEFTSVDDGVEMQLTIKNTSQHDWPEAASIIPCFNPGFPNNRNEAFVDKDSSCTYYVGASGLTLLTNRAIHFNNTYRNEIEQLRTANGGSFLQNDFDNKWPTAGDDARAGVMIRESHYKQWVWGVAWNDFLSAQGHNPLFCMHLSVRVGPLKRGEEKQVTGKVYLFQGTKEECYERYLRDFAS